MAGVCNTGYGSHGETVATELLPSPQGAVKSVDQTIQGVKGTGVVTWSVLDETGMLRVTGDDSTSKILQRLEGLESSCRDKEDGVEDLVINPLWHQDDSYASLK